jgi:hypothetical protein
MNRRLLLLPASLLITALSLTACGSNGETIQEPTTTDTPIGDVVLDKAITGLLPIGGHTVDLKLTAPQGSYLTIKGYIDLGEAADGADCRVDLAVQQEIKGDKPSSTSITIRRDGATTWHRLDKTTAELPVDVSGRWLDATDYNAVRPALIFSPLYITDGMPIVEGAGSGICTLRLLDQTALLDPTSGKVTYDMKRVAAYMNKAFTHFTELFLRAGGAGDSDVAEYLPALVKRGLPDYSSMLTQLPLNLTRNGENIVLTQLFNAEDFSLRATFTPTAVREVPAVQDGKTFFDRLDEDVAHDETVGELLKGGLDAWGAEVPTNK